MSKIAIIGISGLFPGSSNEQDFWNNLMQEKDLIELANERDFGKDPMHYFDAKKGVPDKVYSVKGGFIRNFYFDPNGFQIAPEILEKKDKRFQWSLHVAREALRESGYINDKKALAKCGVILGALSFPTAASHKMMSDVYNQTNERLLSELFEEENFELKTSKHLSYHQLALDEAPSKIVQQALGLGKTHYSIDAACATSLYALKLASDELLTGKSDLMLAGAVCASDQLFIHTGFSIFHAYADENSKFAPLDRNSGGLVSSEGAGMVVLKRLEDAERDGDNILAVICGTGLSNDGRGKFLLSPSSEGQKLAFERAYENNGINPEETTYLECHATGTPLGDKTELNSIANFFKEYSAKPSLGSVKSNMGHLLTAAGMPGLHKVILAMQKELIPPNVNLQNALEDNSSWMGGEQMILKPTIWKDERKQAGINSFGFGGTNAHAVIQNYIKNKTQNTPNQFVKLESMSIIGMEAHFGNCTNLADFYSTIFNGEQHFEELPTERWKGFEQDEKLLKSFGFEDGKAPKGAYIEEFEIDLLRYKVQPKEAETLEPQQALILKVADNAIKDSGLKESQNVAVLIAMDSEPALHQMMHRWDLGWQLEAACKAVGIELEEPEKAALIAECKDGMYFREGKQTPSQHTSFVGNLMACRIAALWDFSGPSFTVSCGENSTFKALEIAQNMLSAGEVDAVVVGAVDLSAGLESVLFRNKRELVNFNEKPSLFLNKGEKGWLVGEGAGAVVLKRTKDVKEEKNYATIDEIGLNVSNQNVDYQELAATGFSKNDKTEKAFLLENNPSEKVALGSVKTNIGHTQAAAGMASLIKTALCLYHKFIPGIPNWEAPEKEFLDKNYYFPTCSYPWILRENQPVRSAAINGLEGLQIKISESVNVEITSETKENTFLHKNAASLFLLKGKDEKGLKGNLYKLELALETATALPKIAHQFYKDSKEEQGKYQIALVAKTKKDLKREIDFFKNQLTKSFQKLSPIRTPKGSYFTPNPLGEKSELAFVYPGSATTYAGVGKQLFQLFPQLFDDFAEVQNEFYRFIWKDYIYPKTIRRQDVTPNIYEDVVAMMSSGVFISYMWTHTLREYFKLNPSLVFGYSMGECSSMFYSSGVWKTANATLFQQSPIFKKKIAGELTLLADHWGISPKEARENWVSLILLAPRETVEELVAKNDKVYLTFINTANEVVISGNKEECLKIATALNCVPIEIPFQNVIHHDFCKTEMKGLVEMHDFKLGENPGYEFFSSLTLDTLDFNKNEFAENSAKVCCEVVDFPRTINAVYEKGVKLFIEVGAASTCTNWTNTILKNKEFHAVAVNQKGKSDAQALMELLAQLTSHGLDLDLSILYPTEAKTQQKRSFFKKIKLGGKRIFDVILSEENKAKFANVKKSAPKRELVLAGVEESNVYRKSAAYVEKTISSNPILTNQHTIQITKKQSKNMMPTIIENSVSNQKGEQRLAENGLPIYDFESGKHLDGKEIIFTKEDLEEFAKGKIANVFGEEYSIIDTYKRRVMLPMYPYLLVSRVTGLKGKLGEYKPSTMQTEYDIPHNAWFTTDRQIPWAVSVESGQCDLLLISYLGIDFQNKGDLVYRLLDCTLTFMDDLPFEGQTLRYDISINSFIRNGDNLLFFFSYRCYVEDRLVLKMDGGCAGFFSDEQLEEGNGVVYSDKELAARKNAKRKYFMPLLETQKTTFSKEDLRHLINGEAEKCFGDITYYANGRNPSLCLPPEKILMLDRIVSVNLKGGAHGLGYIVAEKDLSPDDWFFPCHFRDDEVLAGSLQAEGGGNLLRFFMLMLGLQRLTKDARYQPIYGIPQKVRCRKQVTPTADTKLIYKLEIKEIGLYPNPYVIGDLEIISNDIITVHFENLGLQLREKDNPKYLEQESGIAISKRSEGALLNEKNITAFALDTLENAFGEDFAQYNGRPTSRQPNTDLQVVSRVLKCEGKRGDFSKPSTFWAEYDVPQNAWYYQQNSNRMMPYSVLMEVALQPCGMMGAYLGSTLPFKDKNLFFRNLDGEGQMFDLPAGTDFGGKTIANKAVLTSSVSLGGTVLQNYTFECSIDGHVFYKGKSSFGFFPKEALASQAGLDSGKEIEPWFKTENLQPKDYMQIKLDSLYGKMKLFKAPEGKPHYRLADGQLKLIDTLKVAKAGGNFGKGYVHATRFMQPYDWFFTCHFYTDPVMPGSLGVEAMMQAMQVFALQQDLGKEFQNPKFIQLPNHKTNWKYRGQILQNVKEMHLEIHIKTVEKRGEVLAIIGDAFLWNEGMRIYQVTDLGMGIVDN